VHVEQNEAINQALDAKLNEDANQAAGGADLKKVPESKKRPGMQRKLT
jgi:hypothetical protein